MSNFKVGTKGLGRLYPRSYRTWCGMRERCYNANSKAYRHYGARGIIVCDRWHNFDNFVTDMGERPEGTSLDRFPNNDGIYETTNCRWATAKQQANNRRVTQKPEDIAGQTFGKLTVLSIAGRVKNSGEVMCSYRCDCGRESQARKSAITKGKTKSCGCSRMRENNATWSNWPTKRIRKRSPYRVGEKA